MASDDGKARLCHCRRLLVGSNDSALDTMMFLKCRMPRKGGSWSARNQREKVLPRCRRVGGTWVLCVKEDHCIGRDGVGDEVAAAALR